MIFVTVGTELPFDRMVQAIDAWAREHERTDVFAQIGRTEWRPSFIPFTDFLEPADFNRWFARSTLIVAHAGMGTILSSMRYDKPILVMPRAATLGEHRNDHQIATVKHLLRLNKINVALDELELRQRLEHLEELKSHAHTGPYATPALIAALRDFIHRGEFGATAVENTLPATGSSSTAVRRTA